MPIRYLTIEEEIRELLRRNGNYSMDLEIEIIPMEQTYFTFPKKKPKLPRFMKTLYR